MHRELFDERHHAWTNETIRLTRSWDEDVLVSFDRRAVFLPLLLVGLLRGVGDASPGFSCGFTIVTSVAMVRNVAKRMSGRFRPSSYA